MNITEDDLRKFAQKGSRPIAGQSLTRSPDEPYPWEKVPQFVTKDEAMNYFIDLVMDKETFPAIMDVLAQGVPVMEIVQLMLMQGFKEGVINPDLMLLLAEPFAYLLLGLAERQGIRAKIVDDSDEPYDPDDPDNLDEEEEFANNNLFKNKLQTITKPQDDEELNLEERLPSLMARGE
jgi:hypothetical protein